MRRWLAQGLVSMACGMTLPCGTAFAATLWTPSTPGAPAPNVWLDAADASTLTMDPSNPGHVLGWTDKSGQGDNASTSAPYAPTLNTLNGLSTVDFGPFGADNAHSHMTMAARVNVGTVFIVWGSANGGNFMMSDDGGYWWHRSGPGAGAYASDPLFDTTQNYSDANLRSGDADTRINGGVVDPTRTGLSGDWDLVATRTASGSALPFNTLALDRVYRSGGKGIAEMITFPGRLGIIEVQRIEGYLAWKWGLQGKLASTHPYKTHAPVVGPMAQYHLDESTYAGAAGEVTDSSGNGLNGQAIGNPLPVPTVASPALSGDPGTCGSVQFGPRDGGNALSLTNLPVHTEAGAQTTVTFWMYWDGTDQEIAIGWDQYNLFFNHYNGDQFGFDTYGGGTYGVSSTAFLNQWHHIAAVFTNGSVGSNHLYVDGVDQTLGYGGNSLNDGVTYVASTLQVSGWPTSGSNRFSGRIDEVQVFDGALTASEVAAVYAQTHACPAPGPFFNGSFEIPSLGAGNFSYGTTGATWVFTGRSGISANGSPFTATSPNAPDGQQAAILQIDGNAAQTFSLAAGTYNLAFKAVQRAGNSGTQTVQVSIDGLVIGSYQPPAGAYGQSPSYPFTVAAGSHTIQLAGAGSGGSDYTAFVDDVQIALPPSGTPTPGGFNAFESATAAGSVSGVIHTKIAGAAFPVDVVALSADRSSVLTAFYGDVRIELLDASDNTGPLDASTACRSTWSSIPGNSGATLTLASSDAGRKTLSLSEANAWRDVRVRITYPATGAAATVACSTDDFAIRPSAFTTLAATDADSATLGTARTLANASASGGNVHKAGQPFAISAVAVNAAGATATAYAGAPAPVLSNCGGSACVTPGSWTNIASEHQAFSFDGTRTVRYGVDPNFVYLALTGGGMCDNATFGDPYYGVGKACDVSNVGGFTFAPQAAGGVINASASYAEAGSFALQLVDSSFASVDANDGSSPGERDVVSNVIDVGRFIPDHFDLVTLAAPVLRTFDSTSCSARSFTYLGQPFGFASTAQATVLARNAAGATTRLYANALWKLSAGTVAQGYAATPTTPSLNASAIQAPSLTSNGNGTGLLVGAAGDKLAFVRPGNAPVAPFNASIALTWSATDSSEAAVSGNGNIATTAPLVYDDIAFDAGNQMRFGVLRMTPAYGSELVDLPVLIEAQYWDGQRMATNAADQCTSLPASAVAMGNYQRSLAACKTTLGVGSTALTSGRGYLKLAKPGHGNAGSVDLAVQLGASAAGQSCGAVGGPTSAASAAGLPWLQGRWGTAAAFDQNPSTRASFGQYRSPLIYLRETY